jgi:hypothetical protein
MYVSGTAYFNNITVFGTQSVAYISSSQLNIGTNIISVNTDTPSVRFGGLAVYDSGSTGLTGSMLWDSEQNHWVYTNPSGSTYSGGMLISGPRASALGSEQGTTNNALMKGQGGDHITSSGIFESGSGNVGIGTSSPNAKLEVNGNIYTTSNTNFLLFGTSSAANPYIQGISDDSIAIGNKNTARLSINPSGNVGIGTTSPGVKLYVSASDADYATIIKNTNTSGYGLQVLTAGSSTNLAFQVRTNNASTNAFQVLDNGNVGIGTTSPQALLDIRGQMAIGFNSARTAGTALVFTGATDNTTNVSISTNTFGTGVSLVLGTGGSPTALTITNGGNVGIGTTSPATKLEVAGNVSIQNGYNLVIGDSIANPVASTSKAALTLRKFSSGNASTVISASYYIGVGGNEYTTGSYRLIGFGYAETSATTTYPSYIGYIERSTSGYTYGDLIFGTRNTTGASDNPTERMRILSDGNVGISTTSPGYKLDVNGEVAFSPNTAGKNTFIFTTNASNDGRLLIKSDTTNKVDIQANGVTYFNGGNVGIGTTSPSQKLHIMSGSVLAEGGGTNNGIIIGAAGNNVGGAIKAKGVSNEMMYFDSTNTVLNGESNIYFRIANSDKVTINSSGNIGIGTTGNINYKLIANGGIGIGNGWGTSGATLEMTTDNVGSGGANLSVSYWGSSSYGPLTFSTSNSIRMTIKGDGNFDYGGFNVQSSNNSVYRQAFWGAMSIMWRNAEDAYINSNHTYSSSNTNVASYTSGNGIGRLGIYGGFLEWGSYDGSVSAGTAYTLSSKFIITKAGNVGIGTTSPATKLQISGANNDTFGQLRLLATGTGADAQISFETPSNGRGIYVDDSDTNKMKFYTGAGKGVGDMVTFDNSGNVGIGSTSPLRKLVVSGDTNIGGSIVMGGITDSGGLGTGAIYMLEGQGIAWYNSAFSTGRGSIQGTSAGHIILAPTANVGIGTTSPSKKLQVYGSDNVFEGILVENSNSNAYALYQSKTANSSIWQWGTWNDNSYRTGISGVGDFITITSGGNVGIGLTNPLATLATLGGAVQIMGDYRNHATIIKSAGANGTLNGQLTITIPEMSNASTDGYGGYSCEVYVSGYSGIYCHAWFSGYNNGGITPGEATILRSNGGWSISQSSYGANNQGFQFVINYPDALIHPTARIIFNKGGSPNATAYPANSITAVWS